MALHYINGKFTAGSGTGTISVLDPATEETLDTVPQGNTADALAALDAAKDAFSTWRRTPANARATMMHEAAAKMRAHKEKSFTCSHSKKASRFQRMRKSSSG